MYLFNFMAQMFNFLAVVVDFFCIIFIIKKYYRKMFDTAETNIQCCLITNVTYYKRSLIYTTNFFNFTFVMRQSVCVPLNREQVFGIEAIP